MEEDKDIINDNKTLKILKVKDPKEMILKPYPDILPNPILKNY